VAFWDNLQSIFKIDFSRFRSLKLISDNTVNTTVIQKQTNVTINISDKSLGQNEAKLLKQALRAAVEEENHLLIAEEASSQLEDIETVDSSGESKELLSYFRDKLPEEDIKILRASLYLKYSHDKNDHKNTHKLKMDIRNRYGDRGGKIANLCTAGYFEKVIKPLYEEMKKQEDFSLDKFKQRYDVLVMQSPQAVFVSFTMSKAELKETITRKITHNKRYGVNYLNLHGIGEENVNKIIQTLEDKEISKLLSGLPEIENDQHVIRVKILF